MIKKLVFFLAFLIFIPSRFVQAEASPDAIAQLSAEDFVDRIEDYIDADRYLQARALIKNYNLRKLSYDQWFELRQKFHRNYRLGWDLLLYWDQKVPPPIKKPMHGINRLQKRADKHFEAGRFLTAARFYQKAAQLIRGKKKEISNDNRLLYFSVLHSLARSLYGAGQFKEALTVYGWISPIYPRFKQTLVEKTWAAFMAEDLSFISGSVVSQYSSYFGGFIEPEIYLIQIYLYKLLCREEDLNTALENLRMFRSGLAKRELSAMNWAKSNFDTLPYVGLVREEGITGDDLLSKELIEQEQQSIRKWIHQQYESERKQLLVEAGKAQAYAVIALSITKKELAPVEKLPPQDELLKSGLELWPVEDAEDWLDEVGLHRFIGKSQCQKSK